MGKSINKNIQASSTLWVLSPESSLANRAERGAQLVELANALGYPVTMKPMTRDDVSLADEAFFTGTAAEITPIRELDGRVLGAGQRGPITEKIQSLFFDVVNGRASKYRHWLTPCHESNPNERDQRRSSRPVAVG